MKCLTKSQAQFEEINKKNLHKYQMIHLFTENYMNETNLKQFQVCDYGKLSTAIFHSFISVRV